MAAERNITLNVEMEVHPMNSGDDIHSYTKNSSFQRIISDSANLLVKEGIAEKLDISTVTSAFQIADMGCSTGPNTFFAIQNIIEAVKTKFKLLGRQLPEFQVFFNDHASNDFNTLFNTLPSQSKGLYYAAGVPGSFHDRLFPCAFLHFVFSSAAVHWLSRTPRDVVDENSLAWNKGRIYYSNSGDAVINAYANQHAEDMGQFLSARAEEIACGGVMVLVIPARINGIMQSQVPSNTPLEVLGDSLMDLVNKGIIEESKVDSFNIPIYMTSPQELEEVIQRNGSFSIEKMESVALEMKTEGLARLTAMNIRAGNEGLIKKHFGTEIIEELFDIFAKKLEVAFTDKLVWSNSIRLIVLLKRKEYY